MERIATATFTRMSKGLLVLVVVLVAMLAATVPAFAQAQVSVTGVLLSGLPADVGANGTHSITDEASATVYALQSDTVDLDAYVGQQVTVYGTLTPAENSSNVAGFEGNGTLPSIDVTRVEPAHGPPSNPTTETRATFGFELTVKGEPPAATRFFGTVPAEGCISVPLTDPDADGLYTASLDVPRFPAGPVPPEGAEPVSLPVRIVQADAGGAGPCNPTRVIRDFGVVPANDATFEARVNFKKDPVSPEEPADECLAVSENPEECEDYVAPGGSGSGSGGAGDSSGNSDSGGSGSDDGSSAGNGSSGDGSSNNGGSDSGGFGNGAERSGVPSDGIGGIRGILPSTGGGMALWVIGAGILLIGGGLLVRRIYR